MIDTFKLCLSIFLISILISCKKENKLPIEKSVSTNELGKKQSEQVVIIGNTTDSTLIKSFVVTNGSYGFGSEHKDLERKETKQSLILTLDSIQKPMVMEALCWDENKKFYNIDIFVSPGDSIQFSLKENGLFFYGKHAEINNFLFKIHNDSTLDYGRNPYKGDLTEYKKNVELVKNKRLAVLTHLKAEGIAVEPIEAILKYDYLYNLISPRHEEVNGYSGHFINSLHGLSSMIDKEYSNNERLFNLSDYLDNTTLDDFKTSEIAYDYRYKNSLNAFIRLYFDTSNHPLYSKEKYDSETTFIKSNFEGDQQDYLLVRLLWDYNLNGFGYSKANADYMKSFIHDFEQKTKNSSYLETMETIKTKLAFKGFSISKKSLDTQLINKWGDTLQLADVLKKSGNKIKVLNFWASWCGPCVSEIQKTKAFKDRLMVEKNLDWIYLSIDDDKKTWLDTSNKLKDHLNVPHEYFVIDGGNSALGKSIKLHSIPRYLILDAENKIGNNSAPHPSYNTENFEKLISEIQGE